MPAEALLQAILFELRELRADLSRHRDTGDRAADLLEAIAAEHGAAPFTARDLFRLADAYPHSDVAAALHRAVDMNNEAGRATALGMLLATLPRLELVGTRRNAALYRLRAEG